MCGAVAVKVQMALHVLGTRVRLAVHVLLRGREGLPAAALVKTDHGLLEAI
mgnify:CR=1 FL=1